MLLADSLALHNAHTHIAFRGAHDVHMSAVHTDTLFALHGAHGNDNMSAGHTNTVFALGAVHDAHGIGNMSANHTATSFAIHDADGIRVIPIHNNNNLQYYGQVGLGSGNKPFRVIFDTGSEPLWVPHIDCTSQVCKSHHRFDPEQSSSFEKGSGGTNLAYGTGHVKIEFDKDTLMFPEAHFRGEPQAEAPTTAVASAFNNTNDKTTWPKYSVGLATSVAKKPFQNLSMIDGIFGMGPKTEFAKNQFAVYLSNDTAKDGQLVLAKDDQPILGAMKDHSVSNDIVWHKTVSPNSWSLELVGIKVGDKLVGSCSPEAPCKALIDTGSSNITGPPDEIGDLIRRIHPVCGKTENGPEVTLLIKESPDGAVVPYKLSPKEYSVDFKDTKECNLGISGLNMGEKKWVLGDTFLRRYISLYDSEHHRVGFVKSHHDNENIGVVTRACMPQILLIRRRAVAIDFLF